MVRFLEEHSSLALLAGVVSVLLFLPGCQKRAAPQIRPDLLSDANQAFESRDYLKAAQLYQAYIDSGASPRKLEEIVFQQSLALMGVDHTHGLGDACEQALNRLLQDYPESPFRTQAHALLSFHGRLHGLQQQLNESEAKLESQTKSLASLNQRIADLEARLEGSKEEKTLLQSHLDIRRERIEGLSKELSERERQVSLLQAELLELKEKMRRLKKIDFEALKDPSIEDDRR